MSDADLSALLDGELSAEEQAALEERLASEPELARELEELRELRAQLADLPRMEPPPDFAASVMSKVGPMVTARAAKAMHPERHGASGRILREKIRREKKRKEKEKQKQAKREPGKQAPAEQEPTKTKRKSSRKRGPRDPFADDPFAGAEPADLEALGPNLNAYVDGELSGDELVELEALIDVDPTVELEVERLRELRGKLADLPRLLVPTDFTARILDEVEALEREDARRQSEARQAKLILWRNVTRFAQAAMFLLVAGGGLFLTTPQDSTFGTARSWGGSEKVARAPLAAPGYRGMKVRGSVALQKAAEAPASDGAEEAPAAAQLAEKLGKRRVDADWELAANAEIDQVADTAKALLRRYATPENEVRSKADAAFFLKVQANQVDDLLEALEKSGQLSISPETRESLERLHVEEDRLVLKNGFVLVGKVVEKGARHYEVTRGGVTQLIDRQEVERLERAATIRRVRLLVR